MQLRCSPRTYVRYQASVETDSSVGEGTLFDLSATGCRIHSAVTLLPGNYIEIHIEAPEMERPLDIEVSVVRWRKDDHVGIEFLRYAHGDRERVTNLVEHLLVSTAAPQQLEEEELALSTVSA